VGGLAEPEEEVSDVGVALAGLDLAAGVAALVLAAGARPGRTQVELFWVGGHGVAIAGRPTELESVESRLDGWRSDGGRSSGSRGSAEGRTVRFAESLGARPRAPGTERSARPTRLFDQEA
jgi:hypothetical protein